MRRTVAGEAVLAVVVLGVTASLVNTAPARVAYVAADRHDGRAVAGKAARSRSRCSPAKQGRTSLDVYLVKRDGTALSTVPELTRGCCRRPAAGSGR